MSSLVLLPSGASGEPRRISLRDQLFGMRAEQIKQRATVVFETALGDVGVSDEGSTVSVSGDRVPTAYLSGLSTIAIVEAKRGFRGQIGDQAVFVNRPRFTVRFNGRDALLRSSGINLRATNRSRSTFEVLDETTKTLVGRHDNRGTSVAPELRATELSAVLLLIHCGIMQQSSLLSFVTI
jgi:hypothetical protein